VERPREFGGYWLGLELIDRLGLQEALEGVMGRGREKVPWPLMALTLVLCRLCDPSSELHIAEHLYERSGLADLLGVSGEKINEDRLYRALDAVLPHKDALQKHLGERLEGLFDLEYDLLLYDMTSTYFEGEAEANPLAKRGYSRDSRPDCKQVTIALVVSRCGMPLGYEVFAGNRNDVTTVEEIVGSMEACYGRADRIWVMDRGMVSEENLAFLREGNRRYIVGTPKSALKAFERELLQENWEVIREGLEVKRCPSPDGDDETYILCRSRDRMEKERAMHERFEKRMEEGLERIADACTKKKHEPVTIAERIGRLRAQNSRASRLFETRIRENPDGSATLVWSKSEKHRAWSVLSEGCYLLRSNIPDWSAEDLWRAYIQLTEAEAAFRIHKSDLAIRPIWHQRAPRVQAHILVCFLAYVLWKTLAQMCKRAGLGDEPRRVLDELKTIRLVDVVLPTRNGIEIRKRCITRPTKHQQILLDYLGLSLPRSIETTEM